VGDWYLIGVTVGVAVGVGVLFAALIAGARVGVAVALAAAAAAGVGIGLAIGEWDEAAGGAVGGILGAAGASQLVRGTLRRGGTRAGTALLLGGAALVVAALALVPVVGYVEAVVVPALAARLRRRAGDRYAGLRVLARD
jgi:hypothetical protein